MDLGLRGKAAIVTGASKGIGKAIALALAEEGADVAVCARDATALDSVATELKSKGVEVHTAVADAGDVEQLNAFLDGAHDAFERIDVLVNNAPGWGITDDERGWQDALNVDVMGAVRAIWKVTPWMEQSGAGAIVNIASIAGLEGGWPVSGYVAAKAAMIGYSRNLATALAPRGIRVNVVAPGSIEFPAGVWDTVRQRNPDWYDSILAAIPFGRLGTPEEVANAVVFLASEKASWITGTCLVVDGGQHKGGT
jgi:3-oxoacyl-[acyl-carrier protein] reductase